MPPLPQGGSAYPPGSSYEPLSSGEYDLESSRGISNGTQIRTYAVSPYQSEANSPTQILKSFLESTRTKTVEEAATKKKQLHLRITVKKAGNSKAQVSLDLPELTDYDSIPFALANDTPCLRGLPSKGQFGWRQRIEALIRNVRSPTRLTIQQKLELHRYHDTIFLAERNHLQLWNTFQGKAEYAQDTSKLLERVQDGLTPPWRPLLDSQIPEQPTTSIYVGQEAPEEDAMNFGGTDFDLGQVFVREKRQRPASKYISNGLQETIERFSDDRHFSKWLICREAVYGWDWEVVKDGIRDMTGKYKKRQEEIEVKLSVDGLEARPVFHVVWTVIPMLERMGCGSHPCLIGWLVWSAVALVLVVLGAIRRPWTIALTTLVTIVATLAIYLVRTQTNCVYDGVGTAWSLRPSWVKAQDLRLDLTEKEAQRQLGTGQISKKADGWYTRQGVSEQEWLEMNRSKIRAALERQL